MIIVFARLVKYWNVEGRIVFRLQVDAAFNGQFVACVSIPANFSRHTTPFLLLISTILARDTHLLCLFNKRLGRNNRHTGNAFAYLEVVMAKAAVDEVVGEGFIGV